MMIYIVRKNLLILICLILILPSFAFVQNEKQTSRGKDMLKTEQAQYTFPDENEPHEGTWLIWPHAHTYGKKYAHELEPIWIQMVKALAPGEKVHIIAYNESLKRHIQMKLSAAGVDSHQVNYVIAKSNDVWVRDTGPMFVFDQQHHLKIVNFSFNGWGKKTPYQNDNQIPQKVAQATNIPLVNDTRLVLEGGAINIAADGTVLACRSSVTNKNRNPQLSQAQIEQHLRRYLGAKHFIWLDGVTGEDITDAHIDGFARFYNEQTIMTVPKRDFFELYEGIKASDYRRLKNAKNAAGKPYHYIEIPLTKKNVTGLDYKGSYLNYYLGNKVLLLPVYGDANDRLAIKQMQELYPDHQVVPINVTKLYKNGGMLHCVTQQQPYR